MNRDLLEAKLRQEIRKIICEDDYGGMDVTGNIGPHGASFGSNKDLYNVFIAPFTDVAKIAAGKTKEMSVRAQTLGKAAIESIATTLIPVLKSDYDELFAREQQALDQIKSQYQDVYDASWDAIRDNDIATAAFLFAPGPMLTAQAARKAPQEAIKLISVLTGGRLDNFLSRVSSKFDLPGTGAKDTREGPGFHEHIVRESSTTLDIGKVLTQPKIINRIEHNPRIKTMQDATRKAVNATLTAVVSKFEKLSRARTLQDIKGLIGDTKGFAKLNELKPDERKQAEEVIVDAVKKGARDIYKKNIETALQRMLDAGIPKSHPLVKEYEKVISKIS